MRAGPWLVLAVALAVAGGCSINHRSGDFACQSRADCSGDRSCVDGFCVLAADAGIDAPPLCPPGCTSCNAAQKSCTIDCALGGCTSAITCPAGWSCNVLCSTANSCRNGVNCTDSKSCTITCSGFRSCQNIACGSGRCSVDCSGSSSCRDVQCGASCACDVTCHLNSLCDALACTPNCDSTSQFGGCSSLGSGCNTCP